MTFLVTLARALDSGSLDLVAYEFTKVGLVNIDRSAGFDLRADLAFLLEQALAEEVENARR